MKIGVAIVAYNRLECLRRCLQSVFQSESLSLIDSLAVFDDGSSYDLSAEIVFRRVSGQKFSSRQLIMALL